VQKRLGQKLHPETEAAAIHSNSAMKTKLNEYVTKRSNEG
jgi:hypothetical protein